MEIQKSDCSEDLGIDGRINLKFSPPQEIG
jgi:hypothetical protein